MSLKIYAAAVAAMIVVTLSTAEARPRRQAAAAEPVQSASTGWPQWAFAEQTSSASGVRETGARRRQGDGARDTSAGGQHRGLGPRPGAWCGWYMRTRHGGGPEMNIAWNWRRYGSPGSPQVGAIVVWRHHVGEIVGQASNGQWIVLSGNDSHRVRQRPRSITGAVVRV